MKERTILILMVVSFLLGVSITLIAQYSYTNKLESDKTNLLQQNVELNNTVDDVTRLYNMCNNGETVQSSVDTLSETFEVNGSQVSISDKPE